MILSPVAPVPHSAMLNRYYSSPPYYPASYVYTRQLPPQVPNPIRPVTVGQPYAKAFPNAPTSSMASPIFEPPSFLSSTNSASLFSNVPGWMAPACAVGATLTSAGLIAYNALKGKKNTQTHQQDESAQAALKEDATPDLLPAIDDTQAVDETAQAMPSNVAKVSTPLEGKSDQPATSAAKTGAVGARYGSVINSQPTIHHAKSVFLPEVPSLVGEGSVAFTVLQKLFLQSLSHRKEDGNIKLFLGSESAVLRDGFSWLGDMLPLLGKPVDVVVSSEIGKTGLSALVNTGVTGGKAFMLPNAMITLHASNNIVDRSHAHFKIQTAKRLSEQSLNSLASLIMRKSGEKNREIVLQDLKASQGDKTFNALQALYYGTSGLIDGIPLKNNLVITRASLDRYLTRNGIKTHAQIEDFLKNPLNIKKIPALRMLDAFPASLPIKAGSNYTPLNAKYLKEDEKNGQAPVLYLPPSQSALTGATGSEQGAPTATPSKIQKRLSLTDEEHGSFALDVPGVKPKSLLINDNIFYGDAVSPKLIGKLFDALTALDDKKLQQVSSQHIKLYLQSPGGNISSEKMFLNTVQSIKTPVDIIAVGMVASAAAGMLSGATGLRLALPQASIMIHEPSLNTLGDMSSEYFEDNAKLISNKTGRPFKEVLEDQKREYYMNPLEALCYGPHGFIDGILVDGQRIITRSGVVAYLAEKMGSSEAAERYIEDKLFQLRNPSSNRNQKLDEKDPFSNPMHTIQEVAKRHVKILGQDKGFVRSGPDLKGTYFEQMNINDKPQFKIQLKIGGGS